MYIVYRNTVGQPQPHAAYVFKIR